MTPSAAVVQSLLRLGLDHQRAGRLAEAERLYRQALDADRRSADAMHLLGVVAHQRGDHRDGARRISRALALAPHRASFHHNLADAYAALGLSARSTPAYRRSLALEPAAADTWRNLAVAALTGGAPDRAATAFRRAIRAAPERAQHQLGLAHADKALGRIEAARTAAATALSLDPGLDEARYLLAALGGAPAPERAPAGYVRDLFDKYAEGFERHLVDRLGYRTPDRIAEALTRALGPPPPGGRTIVDLGCGTGLMGRLLRGQAHHMTGVDLSPRMIETARAAGYYDALAVDEAEAALARLPAGGVDLVVAADMLVYLGALDGLFAAAARVLAPGGALAVSTEDAEAPPWGLKASLRYGHAPDYVEATASGAGFARLLAERAILRRQDEADITGTIHVFTKS